MITPSLFNNFDLFDQHFPFSNALSLRPSDNDDFFGLRPFRRDPFFSDFFDSRMTPFDDMMSRISPFSSSGSIDDMFENFKKKMDEEVKAFEELEKNPPKLEDPEHTSCFMKMMTNDNGHVKVKTLKKTPKTEWESRVEEYDRRNPSLENNKKNGEDVQIEDGAEPQEQQQEQQQIQGSSSSQ